MLYKFPELNSLDEFQFVFQITRKIIFEVNYATLGSNPGPHFSTSAAVFNQPKTDYSQCGQCQENVLKGKAKKFYEKWDYFHLKDISENKYDELVNDLKELSKVYNFYGFKTESRKDISFSIIKELSMMELKIK